MRDEEEKLIIKDYYLYKNASLPDPDPYRGKGKNVS
jgi:hypothetical protein